MRRYRRRGVGLAAAARGFDRFPGPWEVRQRPDARRRRRSGGAPSRSYTGGAYREVGLERRRLDRPGPVLHGLGRGTSAYSKWHTLPRPLYDEADHHA